MRIGGVCGFAENMPDDTELLTLSPYIAAASVSSIKNVESGSGGIGALDQSKTVGKGRTIEAVRNGGRDRLIRGSGKSLGIKGLVDGHGHGHEQKHERAHSCLSSVAAPRGSSPVVHSHENAVLTTTPTTTKNDDQYCS